MKTTEECKIYGKHECFRSKGCISQILVIRYIISYYIYFDMELSNIELNKIGLLYTDESICIFRQQSFFELIPKNCMFHYDVEEGVPS